MVTHSKTWTTLASLRVLTAKTRGQLPSITTLMWSIRNAAYLTSRATNASFLSQSKSTSRSIKAGQRSLETSNWWTRRLIWSISSTSVIPRPSETHPGGSCSQFWRTRQKRRTCASLTTHRFKRTILKSRPMMHRLKAERKSRKFKRLSLLDSWSRRNLHLSRQLGSTPSAPLCRLTSRI